MLRMTTGNWIFWAIMTWIGINFLWIAIFINLPAWIGAIIATVVAFLIIKFGPRPKEESEEEAE